MEGIEEHILDKLSMPQLSQIRFPLKLWKLLNSCDSGAISWSIDGDSFIINRRIFQAEFLGRKCHTFKTQNISSLVRQLNLYGFQKVQRRPFAGISRKHWPDLLEYRHTHFRRGFPELVNLVQRRSKEDEESKIASNSLSQYLTQEPLSNTKPLQNQDGTNTDAPNERTIEMGSFDLQETATCSQDHSQPRKLPPQPLCEVGTRNVLQNIPLQGQGSVFQFPITVPENSLQPITLPFKIESTVQSAALGFVNQDNLSTINVNERSRKSDVGGNLFVQGNILTPIVLPLSLQVLENGFQTVQTNSLHEPCVQTFQGQTIQNLQANSLQNLGLATFQGQIIQTLQTDSPNERGIQAFQGQTIQTPQTDYLREPSIQTIQGQIIQTLQTDSSHEPDVKTFQGQIIQTLLADSLQEPGVQTVQGQTIHTLLTEQVPGQAIQSIQTNNLPGRVDQTSLREEGGNSPCYDPESSSDVLIEPVTTPGI
ncbi:uncharacterized protein LOC117337202 [Pecten maximus]|uniref:uncharacterized protein LOC117337202 n=1 Tax=Pecten maximus TaxID=6579 RepID=UPI00145847BF|nr:uncharacterized protein LOC117337202 [Pecten maximus]